MNKTKKAALGINRRGGGYAAVTEAVPNPGITGYIRYIMPDWFPGNWALDLETSTK